MASNDRSSSRARRWTAGERPSAEKLNEVVDAVNRGLGVPPPSQIVRKRGGGSGSGTNIIQFKITSIQLDTIIGQPWDGSAVITTDTFQIAKPILLRTTNLLHSGVSYSYTSADGQRRLATQGATSQNEILVPLYAIGDIIDAYVVSAGDAGISNVFLKDVNSDGRYWAEEF